MSFSQLFSSFTQSDRLIRLHTPLGAEVLLAERLEGIEEIFGSGDMAEPGGDNDSDQSEHSICGYRLRLEVLSSDAHIELKTLLGQSVLIELLTQSSRSDLRPFHGLVTHIEHLGANGGFARYVLRIEPWLAILDYNRDSYIFQDKSIIDIIETVFRDYQGRLAAEPAWRFDLADPAVYKPRSLVTQYNESDLGFLKRLIAEEGLYFWFEHQGDLSQPGLGLHRLVIADHAGAFSTNAQPLIRYQRRDATEAEDSIQQFHSVRQIQTNAVELASWDYKTLNKREQAIADQADLPLTQSDVPGVYAYSDPADGARYAKVQLEALAARQQYYHGRGSVRSLAPGSSFQLTDHPDSAYQSAADSRYSVVRVQHQAHNNLSAELRARLNELFPTETSLGAPDEILYENRFSAIRADLPYRPLDSDLRGRKLHPKPIVIGSLSAIVVGHPDAPLMSERDHRIKIQYHWQRGQKSQNRLDHPHQPNAPADASSGTWVRVASAVAGANWGGVCLPRIGQEVLVQFLEGDIDRPVVVGATYNGQGTDEAQSNQIQSTAAAATANAPAWFAGNGHNAVLSGIKTQELKSSQTGLGGYNQIVFDDTPKESRLSLTTTQQQTELNLGHLKEQRDNRRLQDRGHGFELKTRAFGAVRAGQGLLLSTDARLNARSDQLDAHEASSQLEASHQLAAQLAKSAQDQHAALGQEGAAQNLPALKSIAASQASIDSRAQTTEAAASSKTIKAIQGGAGSIHAYSDPAMILTSPAGIAAVTSANAVLNANETLSLIAQDIDVAVQENFSAAVKDGISLYTYGKASQPSKPNQETGIKLHAAHGQVEIEAQSAKLHAAAERDVTIASNANIDIAAPNHVLLNSGGAYIKLAGGNIEVHAPGKVTFKAGMKVWTGPKGASYGFTALPKSELNVPLIKRRKKYLFSV